MLYYDNVIDLVEHKMIEVKTDTDIVLTEEEKKANFEIAIANEAIGKFCFIKDCYQHKTFFSYNEFNGGISGSGSYFNISAIKDRSSEKDATITAGTVICYLCYLVKDIYPKTEMATDTTNEFA